MSILDNTVNLAFYEKATKLALSQKLNKGSFIKIRFLYEKIQLEPQNKISLPLYKDYEYDDLEESLYDDLAYRFVFIHGPYGSGKSTLLLKLMEQNLTIYSKRKKLFLLCDLSRIEPSVSDIVSNLENYTTNEKTIYLIKTLLKCSSYSNTSFKSSELLTIYEQIILGKIILLIDAFDEGLLRENFEIVRKFTKELFRLFYHMKEKSRSKVVITSRTEWNIQDFIPSLSIISDVAREYVSTLDLVQMLNLNSWDIEEYITSYFENNIKGDQHSLVKRFLIRVKKSFWDGDLARNPMHLNMLCALDLNNFPDRNKPYNKYIKFKLYNQYLRTIIKKNKRVIREEDFIELSKECMISGRLYVSLPLTKQWHTYDLTNLRKIPILKCEELNDIDIYRVGFYHKSFLDYYFACAAKNTLEYEKNRDLFDKIELDYNGREFLVGLMGEDLYIKHTKIGWGLPFYNADISKDSLIRKSISNKHHDFLKCVLNPKEVSFNQWVSIYNLIIKCCDCIVIQKEPLLIRSLRYGLIVLKQIHEKVQSWESKDFDDASNKINEIIRCILILLPLLRNKNNLRNVSNVLTIEKLENYKIYFDEETILLVSTTLRSLLNQIYTVKISLDYAKTLLGLLEKITNSNVFPDKICISGIDENLNEIKMKILISINTIINRN